MKPPAANAEPITHDYGEIGTVYFWDETGSFSAEPERLKPVRGTARATAVRKATPAPPTPPFRRTSGPTVDETRRPR